MAKVSMENINMVRNQWQPRIEPIEELASNIEQKSLDLLKETKSKLEAFMNSPYASHKVGERVIRKHNLKIEALQDIHIAIFKAQEISNFFRLYFMPQIISYKNDLKSLYHSLYVEFKADELVNTIYTTNTDKEREAEFLFRNVEKSYLQVKSVYEQMEQMGKFIDEQSFGLNRLDQMIKVAEKLEDQEMFENKLSEEVVSSMLNDATEEQKENKVATRKPPKIDNPFEDIDDDDF